MAEMPVFEVLAKQKNNHEFVTGFDCDRNRFLSF